VNAAERIVEELAIGGIFLDGNEIAVQNREMLHRLGDKIAQQLVHGAFPAITRNRTLLDAANLRECNKSA